LEVLKEKNLLNKKNGKFSYEELILLNVGVTAITHESVMSCRKLRIAVGVAKILQILAVVFGMEIDHHTHWLLSSSEPRLA
jgi:hypothetical protein